MFGRQSSLSISQEAHIKYFPEHGDSKLNKIERGRKGGVSGVVKVVAYEAREREREKRKRERERKRLYLLVTSEGLTLHSGLAMEKC